VVKGEEEIASKKAAGAKAIKDDTEADLAEAMPQLEAALKVRKRGFRVLSNASLMKLRKWVEQLAGEVVGFEYS
jgi:hypothetical protein